MLRNVLLAGGVLGAVAASANAQLTIPLIDPSTNAASGWEVVIFDPAHVDIVTDFVSLQNNRVVIQKFAEFNRIDPFTGAPEAVLIDFRQVAADAQTVSQIVITDERLINNTGVDWVDFENILVDSGQAVFNQGLMSDLSIAPFTQQEFKNGGTIHRVFDGVVAAGATWLPGMAQGGIVIDVDLSNDSPVIFTLKELPSVPAPGSVALLAIGGLIARRRR